MNNISLDPGIVNRYFSNIGIFLEGGRIISDWTFLTKHALALSLIAKQPCITAIDLASAIGTTERAIRRVIADLYASGYIGKRRMGRGIRYSINTDLSLCHQTHGEIAIGDLLRALGWKRKERGQRGGDKGGKKPVL